MKTKEIPASQLKMGDIAYDQSGQLWEVAAIRNSLNGPVMVDWKLLGVKTLQYENNEMVKVRA